MLVRHADRGDFQHARMQRDDLLQLVRIDVEAGDEDHVLLAVDDLGVALGSSMKPMSPDLKKPSGVITLAVSSGRFQ